MAAQLNQFSIEELVVNGQIAANQRSRVQNELASVKQYCPTLQASLQSYIDNTGNESLLITLTGTVPLIFKGTRYHAPINMFIPTQYPTKPPIVFVRPTSGMQLKSDHPNVTRDGECTHSYFRYWNPGFNNLSGAVKVLSEDFSKIPPVVSKVSNPSPPPQPSQTPPMARPSYSPTYASPSMAPSALAGNNRSPSPPVMSANGPYPYPPQTQIPPPPQRTLTPREQLATKIRNRLAHDSAPAVDLQKRLYDAEVELTRELAYLKEMEATLPQISAKMDEVKASCDNDSAAIEKELKEFADMKEKGGNAALVAAVVPVDGFSEQALEETAKRDALEDVMYELMKRMNPDNFKSVMKLIRNSASDQFVSVALLNKMQKTSAHGRSSSSVGPL